MQLWKIFINCVLKAYIDALAEDYVALDETAFIVGIMSLISFFVEDFIFTSNIPVNLYVTLPLKRLKSVKCIQS